MNESFPKSIRLRKRAEFLLVQENGIRVSSRSFLGLYLVRPELSRTRLGITTSKKIGNAVVRNRVRRLVREAFRRKTMEVPEGIDVVVIAKRHVAGLSSQEISSDLGRLGRRIQREWEKMR